MFVEAYRPFLQALRFPSGAERAPLRFKGVAMAPWPPSGSATDRTILLMYVQGVPKVLQHQFFHGLCPCG